MRTGDDVPSVSESAGFSEAMQEMSEKRLGMTAVLDAAGRVSGIFTDGDLRRTLAQVDDIKATRIDSIMTRNPRTIGPDKLAVEAVQIMEDHKVNQLLVVTGEGTLVGALNMFDLFRAKVI
jgi:arabinose-5-phosphate isomerase